MGMPILKETPLATRSHNILGNILLRLSPLHYEDAEEAKYVLKEDVIVPHVPYSQLLRWCFRDRIFHPKEANPLLPNMQCNCPFVCGWHLASSSMHLPRTHTYAKPSSWTRCAPPARQ